jgi:uncharacterized protein YbjT (DUF2867 family)
MIGQGVLLECLADDAVEEVLLINRSPAGVLHPKCREIVRKNFNDFEDLVSLFARYNACFYCLGISSVGMKEEQYHQVTYGIADAAARAIRASGTDYCFCFVSGAGTDATEKGRSMWARVKGKTENRILSMGFRSAFMFRPGFIEPLKGIKSRTRLYRILYVIFTPLFFVMRPFKKTATNTAAMGNAMIEAALHGYERTILGPYDINQLSARRLSGSGT